MKRTTIFAALTGPTLVVPAFGSWAKAIADGWVGPFGDLSLPVRFGLILDPWVGRLAPFAMAAIMLVGPLMVVAMAALAGASSPRLSEVLFWWCLAAASWGGAVWTHALARRIDPQGMPPFAVSGFMAWAGHVALWLSLAAAYAVQQGHRLAHPKVWHPRWLLGVAALGFPGLSLVPVIVLIMSRREVAPERVSGRRDR